MTAPVAAGPHCADALAAIHAAAFPPGEQWDAAAIRVLLGTPGCFGLLHPAGGMLLGRAIAGEAEILTIGVAPDARRTGAGGALLRAALAEAAGRGAALVFLEVSEANATARRLYERHGFTEMGRRRRYYADGSDALVMNFRQSHRAATEPT